jgi:PAS domain S-box-containing protein
LLSTSAEGAAMMLRDTRGGWQSYAVALLAVALAAVLTLALRPFVSATPAIVLIAATLFSAWYGGLWPGLLSAALTTLFVAVYFVEPAGTLTVAKASNALGLLIFLAVMVLLSALTTSRRTSEHQLRQRYAQLDTLHRLSQALSSADSLDAVQSVALAGVKETLEADRAAILLSDEAGVMRFRAWTGLSDGYRAAAEGHSPWPPDAANPQPVIVPDVAQAPDLAALRPVIEAEGIQALAFVPLVHAGRLLGKFMLYYNQPRAFSPAEVALAQTIAGQIAVATQQRQAQAAVRNERERLHVTLSSIGDAVITTDGEGCITFMNGVAQALTEWPQPEALGRPVSEIFHIVNETTGAPAPSPVARVLAEGVIAGLANHTLLLTRSGRSVPIDDSGAPIRDAAGALLGVVLVFRDITERQHAQRLLEARAQQQAALAELGQAALSQTDLAPLLQSVVARAAETLGVEFAKVLQRLPDGSALRVISGVGWRPGVVGQALIDAGTRSQAGYTLKAAEPVLVSDLRAETRFEGMPLLHEHGVVSGMTVLIPGAQGPFGVLGIHTARARSFTADDANFLRGLANVIGAAVERLRVEQALRLARDQNAAILDGIAEGVTVQDRQGRLVYANNLAAQVMGFASAAQLLATPVTEVLERFELFDEHGAPFALAALPGRLALQGQEPPSVTVRFRVKPTGAEFWSVVSARAISSAQASGQAEYAVNIFRDITALKQGELYQRVLAEAGGLLVNNLDYEAQLAGVARLAVPHLGDWCAMHVADAGAPSGVRFVSVAHVDPARSEQVFEWQRSLADAPGESAAARVLRTGQPELYADVPALLAQQPEDPRSRVARDLGVRSVLIVPLSARGRVVGTMSLAWAESARTYTTADLDVAQELGQRLALTADNARLLQEERRARAEAEASRQRLAFLADISNTLSATLDYDTLMQRIAHLLVPYLADYASVYILEDDQRIANVANAHIAPEKQRLLRQLHARVALRLDTPQSLIAQVMRTGQPLLDPDFDWQNQYAGAPQAMRDYLAALRPVSHIILPLTARGRALGVMVLAVGEGARRFTRSDLGLAEEVARRAALAADNAHLFQQSQQLNAELEQRVQERTAELQASNISLEHEVAEREAVQAQLLALAAELRALTTRVESVREEERTRIAREVHDELGGALTGLKMDLTRLRRQAEAQRATGLLDQVQSMLDLLDSTVRTVRRIATDLRPGVLDDFGLVAAIEWQLQDFQTRAGIECRFNASVDELPLPPESATAMFRVFQETLTNVARHAQASQVAVDLHHDGDQVLLRVADNGRGIAAHELTGSKSLGLLGMRERVHLLAGQLEINGRPGAGTVVVVRVPLPRAANGDNH